MALVYKVHIQGGSDNTAPFPQMFFLHFFQELTLAAECEGKLMQAESIAALGFKLNLGDTFSIRGKVKSCWTVGTLVEKQLDPLPGQLLISGQLIATGQTSVDLG